VDRGLEHGFSIILDVAMGRSYRITSAIAAHPGAPRRAARRASARLRSITVSLADRRRGEHRPTAVSRSSSRLPSAGTGTGGTGAARARTRSGTGRVPLAALPAGGPQGWLPCRQIRDRLRSFRQHADAGLRAEASQLLRDQFGDVRHRTEVGRPQVVRGQERGVHPDPCL